MAAVWALATFGGIELGRLKARISQLETEKKELQEFVRRLGASRKVAQADILSQQVDSGGRASTRLRWQEVSADGVLGRPLEFQVLGSLIYFEALVIKFEQRLVGEGDPQRGESLAMFRRVFGDRQPPESGYPLSTGAVETSGAATDEKADFDRGLWKRFWDLVEDPALALHYGVRVAQIEAPAVPVKPGQTWEVSLDAAGGLNLRLVSKRKGPSSPGVGAGSISLLPESRRGPARR